MNMPTRGQRTAKNKMKKVMGEYKGGTLHSGKGGPVVTKQLLLPCQKLVKLKRSLKSIDINTKVCYYSIQDIRNINGYDLFTVGQ
jgi:hypothetical protein